jgi:hypothetical protein
MSDPAGPLHGPGFEAPLGCLYEKVAGPYHICVMPQIFNARLCIARLDRFEWHQGFDCGYDYETMLGALIAAIQWDPETEIEPSGWIRCLNDGRRRPGGDPSQEYINP